MQTPDGHPVEYPDRHSDGQSERHAGIYRWRIILADTDFFQQSVLVSAADFRGKNNWPTAKHFF